MKISYLAYSVILFLIVISSCSKKDECIINGQLDLGEQAIDCGGVCPPCERLLYTTPNDPNLNTLEGLWYENISIFEVGPPVIRTYAQFKLNNSCSVHYTTILSGTNSTTNDGSYISYGQLSSCNYPTQFSYNYVNGLINNDTVVSINSDTLQTKLAFGTTPRNNYAHKNPFTPTNCTTIDWEVELLVPFPANNVVIIEIYTTGIISSTPIVAGQLFYSGSATVNLPSDTSLFLHVGTSTPLPNLQISFNTRLKLNGQVVSESSNVSNTFNLPVLGTASYDYAHIYYVQ